MRSWLWKWKIADDQTSPLFSITVSIYKRNRVVRKNQPLSSWKSSFWSIIILQRTDFVTFDWVPVSDLYLRISVYCFTVYWFLFNLFLILWPLIEFQFLVSIYEFLFTVSLFTDLCLTYFWFCELWLSWSFWSVTIEFARLASFPSDCWFDFRTRDYKLSYNSFFRARRGLIYSFINSVNCNILNWMINTWW